jgi:hypothetical protein
MKTTPCSHGFEIYRPGQTDRLIELIYKIVMSKQGMGIMTLVYFWTIAMMLKTNVTMLFMT